MCTRCGREFCSACFLRVTDVCLPGMLQDQNSVECKDQQLHKYRVCSSDHIFHVPADFYPVTQFTQEELEQSIHEMETITMEAPRPTQPTKTAVTFGSAPALTANWTRRVPVLNQTLPHTSINSHVSISAGWMCNVGSPCKTPNLQLPLMLDISSSPTFPTNQENVMPEVGVEPSRDLYVVRQGCQDPADIPSHPFHYFWNGLNEETFQSLWAYGEVVVVGGLLEQFKIKWTPDYFINQHGEQTCRVINCNDNKVEETTVAKFFGQFGKINHGPGVLKLKVSQA
jgi:lysine-specific demethylase 3